MDQGREPRGAPGVAPVDQVLVGDGGARVAYLRGREIGLTPSEFALLAYLAERPGIAVADTDLLAAMWGAPWHGETTPLQVHISRLRRKLGESGSRPRFIRTVRGLGYRFDPTPDPVPLLPMSVVDLAALDVAASSGDLIYCLTDDKGTLQWVSESASQLCGGEAEDLVGATIFDLVHPNDADILSDAITELAQGRTRRFIARFARPPVPYLALSCLARTILGPGRRVTGFLGECTPLELPARAPDATLARQGTEAIPSPAPLELVYGPDLLLIRVTPHVRFCGWDPDLLIGTPFSPVGLDSQDVRALVEELARAGVDQVRDDLPLVYADGERDRRAVTVLLAFDGTGRVTSMRSLLQLRPEDYA